MNTLVRSLFWIYRQLLSPLMHGLGVSGCRFTPSCSEYAEVAIARFGPARGGWMAIKRISRCHPFSKGGLDNVPER